MKNLLVVAKQRSGTTGLANALSADDRLKCTGEIFHPVGLSGDLDNFFNYMRSLNIEQMSEALFCRRNLFSMFFSELQQRYSEKHIVVDVKYNCIRNADQIFKDITSVPDLLIFWSVMGWPVVWIKRNNSLKGLISNLIAEQSGNWHSFCGTKSCNFSVTPVKITVDAHDLLKQVMSWKDEDELVAKWLCQIKKTNIVSTQYENLYVNQCIEPRFINDIYNKIGISQPDFVEATTNKILPDQPWDLVENFDEVYDVFKGTEYEWMLG